MKKSPQVIAMTVVCLVVALGFIRVASAAVNSFLGKGTVAFDSIKVGRTFLNGTIINNTTKNGANNPVAIGDSLRVDGDIFRTEIGGANPLKIADTLRPSTDGVYSLGDSAGRFLNLYLSGGLIGTGIVGSAAIAEGAVTSAKIADGTIATADLAAGIVTSEKINDGTIATADLATNAVTADKIVDASNASGLRKADIGAVSTSVSINPPSIAAQSCALVLVTLTGAQTGDLVLANSTDGLALGLMATPYDILTANRLDMIFCNVTAAPIDDGAGFWRVILIR